jgi:hypothetical protein
MCSGETMVPYSNNPESWTSPAHPKAEEKQEKTASTAACASGSFESEHPAVP